MIQLDDEYILEADKLCFMLKRVVPIMDKSGNPRLNREGSAMVRMQIVGTYTRISQALVAWCDAVDRDIVADKDMTLQEAVKCLILSRESLKKAIRDALPEVVEE